MARRITRVKWKDWERRKVASDQRWLCADCAILLDWAFEVDHIVPLFAGGADAMDNLQALCGRCHNRKSIEERSGRSTAQPANTVVRCRCGVTYSSYFVHRCDRPGASGAPGAPAELPVEVGPRDARR